MENNQIILGISKNSLYRLIDDPKEAEKAFESLKNYKKNKISDAYDFFNKYSLGNGKRLYNKFTADKLQHSLEYVGTFDYIKHKKMFNLDTKDGMDMHIYRNKNQYHKAPKNLTEMKKFINAGYFIFEGFSPCHNLTEENNNYKGRKSTLVETIYLLNHKLLYRPNQYSAKHNISVRGTPGTSFEGCQFIYNYDTGKLVTDNINRGTWDYGKYATHMHFILDIYPWMQFGNGENLEKPEMFIMSDAEAKLYFTPEALQNLAETKKKSSIFMNDKTTKLEYTNFLKWSNDTKGMIIVHSDEEKDLVEKQLKEAKEDFVDQEYFRNAEKRYNNGLTSNIDMAYKDAWFDYVSFLTFIENREITKGLDNLISYIDTNPSSFKDIISDNKEKEHYGELLFKSAFNILNQEEKNAGTIIKTKLPISITVYFSNQVKDAILDVKNKLGYDEAVNQVHFYRDAIVTAFNKKIANYNFEVRFSGDIVNFDADFDHFLLEIHQFRRVSETESTILNNKVLNLNAQRFIEANKDISKSDDEEIVRPSDSEYAKEAFGMSENMTLVLGSFLVTMFVGTSKLILDKLNEKQTKKLIKEISNYLFKQLSEEYDRLYKINTNIKTKFINSKVTYAFAEYDRYGVYNVYEPKDFMKREDYIEYRSTMILEAIKASKDYNHFLELTKDTYHDNLILDGFMLKEIFEDVDLLNELVKFEYGENSTDSYAKEDYIKSLINQMEEKIYDMTEPYIKTEKDTKYYFYDNRDAIDYSQLGKKSISDQLSFKVGYTINYNFPYEKVKKQIEFLINKI